MAVTRAQNMRHSDFVALETLANRKLRLVYSQQNRRRIKFYEQSQWQTGRNYQAEMSRLAGYCCFERALIGSSYDPALQGKTLKPFRLDVTGNAPYLEFMSDVKLYSKSPSISIRHLTPLDGYRTDNFTGTLCNAIASSDVYEFNVANTVNQSRFHVITGGTCFSLSANKKFGISLARLDPALTCNRNALWPCANFKQGKSFSDSVFETLKGSMIYSVQAIRKPSTIKSDRITIVGGDEQAIPVAISCTDGVTTKKLQDVTIPAGKAASDPIYPRWVVLDNMTLTASSPNVLIHATYAKSQYGGPILPDVETDSDFNDLGGSFSLDGSFWYGTINSDLYNDIETFLNALP